MNHLKLQKYIDYIFGIPVAITIFSIMYFILGYRITNAKEFRRYYKKELANDPSPLLICSNHMTYVDSGFIIWAFSHPLLFWFNYRFFSWNTPAVDYKKNLLFRFVIYMNKGVFIKRGGGKNHVNQTIDMARSLLQAGEVVTIFPEGTRTKTGLFQKDKLKLGVGLIVGPMKKCRVLCMHIRSDRQQKSSGFPPLFSKFTLQWSLLTFENISGIMPERLQCEEIVTKIGDTIEIFEKNYLKINNFSGNSDTLH